MIFFARRNQYSHWCPRYAWTPRNWWIPTARRLFAAKSKGSLPVNGAAPVGRASGPPSLGRSNRPAGGGASLRGSHSTSLLSGSKLEKHATRAGGFGSTRLLPPAANKAAKTTLQRQRHPNRGIPALQCGQRKRRQHSGVQSVRVGVRYGCYTAANETQGDSRVLCSNPWVFVFPFLSVWGLVRGL